MTRPRPTRRLLALAWVPLLCLVAADRPRPRPDAYRSPIALALSTDGTRLLVANQGSDSVALIDTGSRTIVGEVETGEKPAGVALSRDGSRGVVTHWYGYDLAILDIRADGIGVDGRVHVGPEPRGVVLASDGRTAFVAVGASNEVARVDLEARRVTGRVEVGREPRGIALTPDGKTLVVGNARSQSFSVIDVAGWKVERTIPIEGDNLRQVVVEPSGESAYVVNMKNRGMATTANNIDLGWVLGQRLTRARIDGSGPYETVSLDPKGRAVADVHGLAIRPDGKALAISSGGTHEVLLLRADERPLPWRPDGSRDLIPVELLKDDGRFRRVEVGGRPTEMVFSPDGKTVYVANYLADAVQVIDFESGRLAGEIDLGGPAETTLVRRGEALFHDATRSSNQWYSCNTCHSDGHTNGLDFDTMNDGWHDYSTAHLESRKKVPTLRRVAKTGPWTWHGWQTSLDDAMIESFTKSMQGKRPTADDVKAIVAFIGTLDFPRNPNRDHDGGLSPEAKRGEALFRSAKAACTTCHNGPELTDGKIHIVGLEGPGDVHKGYNPPSLRGVYDKDPYLHDGRAKTLRDVLTGPHNPEEFAGGGRLDAQEIDDLVAYLRSL